MYNVKLNICLSGITQDKLTLWQKISPKPHFKHEFMTIKSIDDINKEIPDGHQYLLIVHEESNISIKSIRDCLGDKATIILYAKNLTTKNYDFVDDIWFEQSEAVDIFNFEKILNIIAERKEAWLQKTWLQATINTLPDMIWFKDILGIHLEVNDAFCSAVNKTKDDVRNKNHYYIWDIPKEVYEQSDYVCVETEDDVIAARKTCLFDEEVMKADGNLSKLKTYKTPIFDGDTIIGTVGIARDVTKEYEYLKNIEHLAHYDQLTGLANRNQLDTFLDNLKTTHMTIIYMDLDRFKHVNDTYGHLVGDTALVALSSLIKEIFPDSMNVRIGGDEFISIFTDGANMKSITPRMQILMDRFYIVCKQNPHFEGLSVSAGIAEGKIGHGSFDLLLQRADAALYKAKNNGRGKYYVNTREDFTD